MSQQEIVNAIEEQLASREIQVRNRNALSAVLGAVVDPVGALGKLFLGAGDAVASERHRIEQGHVLELVVKIDQAISDFMAVVQDSGVSVSGLIETDVTDGNSAVGLHIASGSGAVRFEPGTHIKTTTSNVSHTTGLKIGGGQDD